MGSGGAFKSASGRILSWLAIAAALTSAAHASPWARFDGELLVISSTKYFQGDSPDDPADGVFESVDSDTHIEFGLTEDITIGGKVIYGTSWLANSAGNFSDSGFSEVEGFAQYQFLRDIRQAASVKLSAGKPAAFQSGARPSLSAGGADVELGGLYGRNLLFEPVKIFAAGEIGFRKRIGDAADVMRTQGTLGVEPGRHWVLLFETFSVTSLRNENDSGADYDIVKIQPSVIYRFNRRWAVQAGMTEDVSVRNVAPGRTYFIGFWSAF
ncbi:hypothetical protein [Hyphococcus sp.]|uniref:hypothetical protein n=1 Tax=Hyphococcus sp. TaxID=2038636 RepID=UPI003D108306